MIYINVVVIRLICLRKKIKKRVGHKPDSVQWRVIYLGRLLPNASCGTPKTGQEKDQPLPLRPCSQPGFTEPVPHDTAGALLPTPLHPYPCYHGRYFSVALSSRSRALGVIQQV